MKPPGTGMKMGFGTEKWKFDGETAGTSDIIENDSPLKTWLFQWKYIKWLNGFRAFS